MRKLLNKTDKDLAKWLRKTIASNRGEAEFLFKASGDTVLNTLYKERLAKKMPKVLADNGDTLDLDTEMPVVAAAVVNKSKHVQAIESAKEDLANNRVSYTVFYRNIPYLKTYIMISDANERRGYDIFGLASVGYFLNDEIEKFIQMLEA